MIATIKLNFSSAEIAARTLEAINPDNTPLPKGLQINCSVDDTKLVIRIQCERGIGSLGATLEDMMSSIDLSLRTSDSISADD